MKSKYRIMSNGFVYRVQKRFLVFFWRYIRVKGFGKKYILEFERLDKAEEYIEEHEIENKKFKPVTNRRKTDLWKNFYGQNDE